MLPSRILRLICSMCFLLSVSGSRIAVRAASAMPQSPADCRNGASVRPQVSSKSTSIELKTLKIVPASVVGGAGNAIGVVMLTAKAPAGGVSVRLASADTSSVTVPDAVTIEEGRSTAHFVITTKAIPSVSTVSIRATLGMTRQASLTVHPAAALSLSLTPDTLVGGGSVVGVLLLVAPAAKDFNVELTSDNSEVLLHPARLEVSEGETRTAFEIQTHSVKKRTTVKITAVMNNQSNQATLTLIPRSP